MRCMRVKLHRQRWFQLLMGGIILFIITEQSLRFTGNPNYFPTVILLGAFVVPVTFVTYFYEHVRDRDISQTLLTTAFLVGGMLGLAAAGLLEYSTLQNMSILGLFGVGLIEESAKLIFPIAMYIGWRYIHEADGLLFGVASGMGFAALETMGYALVSLIQSGGNIIVLEQVLFLRGLLSPAGHAAWTGFVCAVLWHEREKKGHVSIGIPVIGAFILAVLLHSLWNISASTGRLFPAGSVISITGSFVIAIISLTLVIWRFRKARNTIPTTGSG
jgi:RsiW-degrading membrane proteinase PrsW (M82 family)